MKKNRALFVLLGALVVLLIAYFALQSWNRRQAEKEKAEEESVVVTDIDPDTVTAVSYDMGSGERAFEKQDDTWVYTPDPDFPDSPEDRCHCSSHYGGPVGDECMQQPDCI